MLEMHPTCYTIYMPLQGDTRLDQNTKRVDVGALVTVMNVSVQKRQHYYISVLGAAPVSLPKKSKVRIVKPTDGIAKVLKGKMKGEKVFYKHDLIIEFIAWPQVS